jgi:plasmid stabilization system protein ParE
MAFTVKLSALATEHIEDAYSWIQETNPGALDEWFDGITNALQSLKNLPYRCSKIPLKNFYFKTCESSYNDLKIFCKSCLFLLY